MTTNEKKCTRNITHEEFQTHMTVLKKLMWLSYVGERLNIGVEHKT